MHQIILYNAHVRILGIPQKPPLCATLERGRYRSRRSGRVGLSYNAATIRSV